MGKLNKKLDISTAVHQSKKPRKEQFCEQPLSPIWSFQYLDIDGPWSINNISDIVSLVNLLKTLGDFEKMTWNGLRQKGCHSIAIEDLCKKAQTRLINIHHDDIDELYSFRLSGKVRVWGIKESNIIRLLWWDPDHEVCLSLLKHT